MDVQDCSWKCVNENRAKDSHETGENNEANVMLPKDRDDIGIELFSRTFGRRNEDGREVPSPCSLKPRRSLDIADNNSDFRVQTAGADPIVNSFKVGAAAGKKNAQPTVRRLDFHER
jgi:hypothetical protein